MEKDHKENKFENDVLRTLYLCGFSPLDHGFSCTLKRVWSVASHSLITIGILLELILNYQNFETIIRASKILPVQVTLAAKMLFPALKKNGLKDILNRMKFSLANIYTKEINEVGRLNNTLVHKIYKIHLINTMVVDLAMFLTAALSRNPLALTYNEANMSSAYWIFVLFIESNYLISQSLSTCGIDGLFGYIIAHIVSEMKMLKIAIAQSKFSNASFSFNILIGYHVHLLRLQKDMIEAFSLMFFMEYMMNMGTLCFNLVLLTSDGLPPDMKHIAEYGLLALYLLTALAFLSYAGDVITEQCEQLADTIFHEMTEALLLEKNQSVSLMMIQRSQNNLPFTLGGFFDLNLMNFNTAFANCLRFVMFFTTLKENAKRSQ